MAGGTKHIGTAAAGADLGPSRRRCREHQEIHRVMGAECLEELQHSGVQPSRGDHGHTVGDLRVRSQPEVFEGLPVASHRIDAGSFHQRAPQHRLPGVVGQRLPSGPDGFTVGPSLEHLWCEIGITVELGGDTGGHRKALVAGVEMGDQDRPLRVGGVFGDQLLNQPGQALRPPRIVPTEESGS